MFYTWLPADECNSNGRLHSGWSVKTATINQWKQPEPLTSSEHQMIVDVIQRAEQMEKAEKTRLE